MFEHGTPRVKAVGQYDADARRYTLTLSQSCPATPGQPDKLPFVIPVTLGLVGTDGHALALQLDGEAAATRARPICRCMPNAAAVAHWCS